MSINLKHLFETLSQELSKTSLERQSYSSNSGMRTTSPSQIRYKSKRTIQTIPLRDQIGRAFAKKIVKPNSQSGYKIELKLNGDKNKIYDLQVSLNRTTGKKSFTVSDQSNNSKTHTIADLKSLATNENWIESFDTFFGFIDNLIILSASEGKDKNILETTEANLRNILNADNYSLINQILSLNNPSSKTRLTANNVNYDITLSGSREDTCILIEKSDSSGNVSKIRLADLTCPSPQPEYNDWRANGKQDYYRYNRDLGRIDPKKLKKLINDINNSHRQPETPRF